MNSVIPTDVLFPEASLWAIGCIVVSYFLGFFVRGTFGFGSNIPILLLTTPILGPHHAIVLVAVAAFISQIDLLRQGVHSADWRVSKPLIVDWESCQFPFVLDEKATVVAGEYERKETARGLIILVARLITRQPKRIFHFATTLLQANTTGN